MTKFRDENVAFHDPPAPMTKQRAQHRLMIAAQVAQFAQEVGQGVEGGG